MVVVQKINGFTLSMIRNMLPEEKLRYGLAPKATDLEELLEAEYNRGHDAGMDDGWRECENSLA